MSLLKGLIVSLATLLAFSGKAMALFGPPLPYWSWDGFYCGLNAGVAYSSDRICLTPQGLWGATPSLQKFIGANGSTRLTDWNFIGGAQIGYNYQLRCWLLGLEADGNFVYLTGSRLTPQTVDPVSVQLYAFHDRVDHRWLVTVRPRIGFTLNRLLPYLTGGYATGDAKVHSTIYGQTTNYASRANASKVLHGWTLGGGLEYAFKPNISIKGEYLYVDLGHITTTSTPSPAFAGFSEKREYRVREGTVRADRKSVV
jgi:outer membrane immunogenic protein